MDYRPLQNVRRRVRRHARRVSHWPIVSTMIDGAIFIAFIVLHAVDEIVGDER